MSGHERERLSAYLDGELSPRESAAVAAHLGSCAECTAFVADLAAVDEAAAGLPAEPPQGYFESFPARVRARLGTRQVARPARRVPVWTWAAAAALLLAVVTPLTLRQLRPAGSHSPRGEAGGGPGSAAMAPPRAAVAPPAPSPTPASETPSLDLDRAPAWTPVQRPQATPPAPAATTARAATPPEQRSDAASAPAKDEAAQSFAQEPAAPAPRERAEEPEQAPAARRQAPAAEKESDVRFAAPVDAATEAGASASARAGVAAEGASPALTAGSRDTTLAGLEAQAEAFGRLEAARPRTPAGWRRLREQWSALAAADTDPVRADEARVRSVIAAWQAWRTGGSEGDLAVFRVVAESYLRRGDARQRPRVESLLAEAKGPAPAP